MPREIWKPVVGYEQLYQVSNKGRVKSLPRKVKRGNHYLKVEEKILKPCKINSGRLTVRLCSGGKSAVFLVHRLVATAFIPNLNNLPQINHIDGNPLNNNLENLEWCNQSWQEIHKLYNLKVTNSSLISQPRPVVCVETNLSYHSLGEACRSTGIPLHILFNRLKSGKPDAYGHHWKYVIN